MFLGLPESEKKLATKLKGEIHDFHIVHPTETITNFGKFVQISIQLVRSFVLGVGFLGPIFGSLLPGAYLTFAVTQLFGRSAASSICSCFDRVA